MELSFLITPCILMAAWMPLTNPLFLHPDFSSGAVSRASRSVIEPVEQLTVEENDTLWTEVLEMELGLEMEGEVDVEPEPGVGLDDRLGEHLW